VADEQGIELQHVQPRLFGWIPPLGLLGAGAAVFLAAVVLLATAQWVVASVLFVLGLVLLGLYLVAARHVPATTVGRRAVGGIWRARDELRFAGSSARAWSSAGRQVLSLQRELRRLARERDAVQHALGGAVHRDDKKDAAELRKRMTELEAQMAECAGRIHETRSEAEERVSRARVPLQSTEINKAPASKSGRAGTVGGRSRRPRTRPAG
jgi:hypothetical protein